MPRNDHDLLKSVALITAMLGIISLLVLAPHYTRTEGTITGKYHVNAWTEHVPASWDVNSDGELEYTPAKDIYHPDQYYLYVGNSRIAATAGGYESARINKDMLVNDGFYGSKIIRPEDLKPESER